MPSGSYLLTESDGVSTGHVTCFTGNSQVFAVVNPMLFLSQVQVGMPITINDTPPDTRIVTHITDDNTLTVDSPWTVNHFVQTVSASYNSVRIVTIPMLASQCKARSLWNGTSNDVPNNAWYTVAFDDSAWSAPLVISNPTHPAPSIFTPTDPGHVPAHNLYSFPILDGADAIWTSVPHLNVREEIFVRWHFTVPAVGLLVGAIPGQGWPNVQGIEFVVPVNEFGYPENLSTNPSTGALTGSTSWPWSFNDTTSGTGSAVPSHTLVWEARLNDHTQGAIIGGSQFQAGANMMAATINRADAEIAFDPTDRPSLWVGPQAWFAQSVHFPYAAFVSPTVRRANGWTAVIG